MTTQPLVLLAQELIAGQELFRGALRTGPLAEGELVIFRDAEEGISLLAGRPVDLLVLPAAPDGGGHRSLIARARAAVPEIPVIGVLRGEAAPGAETPRGDAFFQLLAEPLDAGCLGWAVRNALRWRELSRRLHAKDQELQTLDEVGRALLSSLELKTVLDIIMQKTRELVQAEAWTLLLIDEASGELRLSVAVGERAEQLRQRRLKRGEGIPGWVAREGTAVLLEDAEADPRAGRVHGETLGFRSRSVLCVPLETHGAILGVIEVINKKGGGVFTEQDLGVVNKLAGFAALAIENARLYQQTKLLTITDELTHLYNTRFFTQYLDTEVKRCRRYKSSVSLIFLDLDFFKKVNDQHGHLMGSQLLREVADVLRQGVRDVDIVARYGGDEFIVILPETGLDEAAFVAERLRSQMNAKVFLTGNDLTVRLTASFGVASFPETCATEEELIRLADQAMYRVKNNTRDGVYIAARPRPTAGEGAPA